MVQVVTTTVVAYRVRITSQNISIWCLIFLYSDSMEILDTDGKQSTFS